MSSIYHWLNQELRSTSTVTPNNIDTHFRTGYHLGEMLAKLSLASTPTPFIKSSTSQAIIQNFVIIETIAREMLGLRIAVGDVIDVIDGKSGSAIKLIYQIKSCYLAVKNGTSNSGRIPFLMKDLGKKAFIAQDIQHFQAVLRMKFKTIRAPPALPAHTPVTIKDQSSFQLSPPKSKLQPIRNAPIAPKEIEPLIEPVIYADGKSKRKAHFLHEKLYLARHDLRIAKFMKERSDKTQVGEIESLDARITKESLRMPVAERKLKKILTNHYNEKRLIISNKQRYDEKIDRDIQARQKHDQERLEELHVFTKNDIAHHVIIEQSKLGRIESSRLMQVALENRKMADTLTNQLFELSWKARSNIEHKLTHSFTAPTEKSSQTWIKSFVAGHALEDANDFLDATDDSKAVLEMTQRDILDYLSVKDTMRASSLSQLIVSLSPKMDELLSSIFEAVTIKSHTTNHDTAKCALKPISCILGNKMVFESKYFDRLNLTSGCRLYVVDEVIHNWVPVAGRVLDNISMGLELSNEDIVDIIIEEILKNDAEVSSHLLINFPRNEAQSILFEQKLSGYSVPLPSILGDLSRFDAASHTSTQNFSLLSTTTMSTPKQKHETALSAILIPEISNPTLLLDQITKHTQSVLDCIPLDPYEETKSAQMFHLCFEGESIKQVEDFYTLNAFTKIVRFDTKVVKGAFHEYIKQYLTSFSRRRPASKINGTGQTATEFKPSVMLFCNYWVSIEKVFTDRLRFLFRKLRQELQEIENFVFEMKSLYLGYFERPSDIFTRYDALIADYNDVPYEIRSETEFKAEFQLRIYEISDSAVKQNAASYQDSDLLIQKLVNEKFVDEKMLSVAMIYSQIIKAEADKHVSMLKLVSDFYRDQTEKASIYLAHLDSQPLEVAQFENVSLPLLKMSTELVVGKNWKRDKDPSQKLDLQLAASKMKVTYSYIDKSASALATQKASKETEIYVDDLQQHIDVLMKAFSIQESAAGKVDQKKKPADATESSAQQNIIEHEGALLKDRLKNLKSSYSDTFKNEYLSLVLTLDDINHSYNGIINTLIQSYSMILKECIESGSNVPNHFDFQKYQVKLCYNIMTVPSEERKESEARKQADELLEANLVDLKYLKESLEYHAYDGLIIKDVFVQGVQRSAKIADRVVLNKSAITETPVKWEAFWDQTVLDNKCKLPAECFNDSAVTEED